MKLDELRKELASGTIRPVYLLVGDEALLRDDALSAIQDTVLDGAAEDFNLDRLSGESTTPAAVRDALGALPMMASRRLVVLREPEGRRGSSKVLTDGLAEIIPETLEQESSVLVVAASKADKRQRWVKAFAEPAAVVECAAPKAGRSLVSFVKTEAKRQGVKLEKGVAELLAERVGPQLLLMRQEISKAALLAGDGEKVELSHAEQSTGHVADQPIWDLTDAIGEGRTADAVGMLSSMLDGGAPAPVVLGSLASHFRKLLRLGTGGRVPGPPFVVRKLESQARRYPPGRLMQCMHAIHDTDTQIKGASTMRPEMALERLVLGLAS